jgi:hypothetical protein
MENIFLVSGIISFVFFIFKFIEMRFIDKESKPLKILIRDSILVYFTVIIGNFIIEQLKVVIPSASESAPKLTPVFLDNPTF